MPNALLNLNNCCFIRLQTNNRLRKLWYYVFSSGRRSFIFLLRYLCEKEGIFNLIRRLFMFAKLTSISQEILRLHPAITLQRTVKQQNTATHSTSKTTPKQRELTEHSTHAHKGPGDLLPKRHTLKRETKMRVVVPCNLQLDLNV